MDTKIDLDDLEHKARRTLALTEPLERATHEAQREWLRATSPPVTLALIARIRELEAVAERYAGALARESYDEQASEVRAILEKGAVLP